MDMLEKANRFVEQNQGKVVNKYRLKYHLMGQYGWINDPNGFIYYNGKYHLFYQHNPYKSVWGPMHWGHATSKDLIKWEYQPIALAPDKPYDKDGCFSGSAIEKDGILYLLYTGHVIGDSEREDDYSETQCLAFSYDEVKFIKYDHNPVIGVDDIPKVISRRDFRDPKVFKKGETYYMVLGSNNADGRGVAVIYTSSNLKEWRFLNTIGNERNDMGNNWECPDLFELNNKDVLIASIQHFSDDGSKSHNDVIYAVGVFDAHEGSFKFKDCKAIDAGFDFYAPQTTIDEKGRRLIVAWMNEWNTENPTHTLGHNWAGAMTIPREVVLNGDKLNFLPVKEIKEYRRNEFLRKNISLNGEKELEIGGDCYEMEIIFDAKEADEFGVKLRTGNTEETVLSYSRQDELFRFNRDRSGIGPKGERQAKVELKNGLLDLRIFVDISSVEIFINGGEVVMTGRIYPSEDSKGIKLLSKGECNILSLKKWDIM
ncbi:glycoside hydrolase family 32 protein [Xylanivirga thermophila]|jgi:beta-fructofuranosidase|uniref:glycoside hydrolase family 32 protein n=1 Tax=Xylanivirga thermophila TaxID=2496273 RepID=UPI00101BC389|nr:glycoside hydrolase family 32 protein [Xylanivirga thermophila]